MNYKSFMDIDARQIGIPLHDVISYIVQRLHDVRGDIEYALAFPAMGEKPGLGDCVRAFGHGQADLMTLADRLVADRRFDDCAAVRMPRDVMQPRGYEAYMHVRVRTPITQHRLARMSDEQARVRAEIAQRVRQRQIEYVRMNCLPYLRLRSQTQQREFRYYVQRIACEPVSGQRPDGYGLSRVSQVVAVPIVG